MQNKCFQNIDQSVCDITKIALEKYQFSNRLILDLNMIIAHLHRNLGGAYTKESCVFS